MTQRASDGRAWMALALFVVVAFLSVRCAAGWVAAGECSWRGLLAQPDECGGCE